MVLDLQARVKEVRETKRLLDNDNLSFGEYYDMVLQNPSLARPAHARLYDMIMERGTEYDEQTGIRTYNFFKDELFGTEESIAEFMSVLQSAADRSELRNRIYLLMGPPGGGKSTLMNMLKRGLETYSRTDAGALYAIATCPMHEEPLHLIPEEIRQDIYQETKEQVYIEGDLCPVCRYYLEHDGADIPDHPFGADFEAGDIYQIPVKRLIISTQHRVGIGNIKPSDPKSQDVTELVGSMNYAKVGVWGTESHPLAYEFDGELFAANRGLMEWVEALKFGDEFRNILLDLVQDRVIAAERFADISGDEVNAAHTNEHEFKKFAGDKSNEALQDRILLIRVPYNLKLSAEIEIYRKLISNSRLRDRHIAPFTLELAARFALLSRYEDCDITGSGIEGRMRKLELYDGQPVEGLHPQQLSKVRELAKREGMDGISPRYVINQLSLATTENGEDFLHPATAKRLLSRGLKSRTASTAKEVEELEGLLTATLDWYTERAWELVNEALLDSHKDIANDLFNNYLDNIESYLGNRTVKNPVTGEEVKPNEKLMSEIEGLAGVSESGKREFRNQIASKVASLYLEARRQGKDLELTYESDATLKKAIKKKLSGEMKDSLRVVLKAHRNKEEAKRYNALIETLCQEYGYNSGSAEELLRFVNATA